jgi:hypothetical protein
VKKYIATTQETLTQSFNLEIAGYDSISQNSKSGPTLKFEVEVSTDFVNDEI